MEKKQLKNKKKKELKPRELAAQILQRVERDSAFSERTLKSMLDSAAFESRDKAMVTELTYGTLRYQIRLDWIIDKALHRGKSHLPPLVRAALRLGIYQLLFMEGQAEYAAINETVEIVAPLGQRYKGIVNAVLRGLLRGEIAKTPLKTKNEENSRVSNEEILAFLAGGAQNIAGVAIHLSYPPWHAEELAEYLSPEELFNFMGEQLLAARPVIRANAPLIGRAALMEELTVAGFTVRPIAELPAAIIVEKSRQEAAGWPGFNEGHFAIQDGAAQLAAYLLAPEQGANILELCAAPGGKTGHLAECYPDSPLTAIDIYPGKLDLIRRQLARLKLKMPTLIAADATNGEALDAALAGAVSGPLFKAILCDAPCSGLGTLRRHPELRVRSAPEKCLELAAIQESILENALKHLAPGGVLLYTLCTLSKAESFMQVDNLLQRHPELKLADPPYLPPEIPLEKLRLLPAIYPHGVYSPLMFKDFDKFFYARLVKKETC